MADEYSDLHDGLLTALVAEERASLGVNDGDIYTDQINAWYRYAGKPYGNEVTGRSQVHDRSVFETIEWIRPDMSRIFTSGGSAVRVDPWDEGTEDQAQEATDYLNQMFMDEMDGEGIVDAFCFDGLLQKRGVGAVYWADAELGAPEQMMGGKVELASIEQRGWHLLEVKPVNAPAEQFQISFQRIVRPARPIPTIIAPEDFRISRYATSLERPPYCGHIERIMKTDLIAEFEDKRDEIEEYAQSVDVVNSGDERRTARYFDMPDDGDSRVRADPLTDEVILYREYIFYDLNEDGFAELLEVFRLDGCILSVEEVKDNPYFSWTPVPLPHRWFGLGVYDVMKDIQDIKTSLLRSSLDSVYLSVTPRVAVNNKVNLGDLMNVTPGAAVRTNDDKPIGDSLRPITIPDVSGSGLRMLEAIDQTGERRSGISRNAMGMDPDSLNKTATGQQLMQNAAGIRKEQIARNLAAGIESMFRKMYRLIVQQQSGQHKLHMGDGKFRTFSPSQWSPDAKVRIHVGNGTGDRQTKINQLRLVQQGQKEFMGAYGKNNPIVGVKQLYQLQEDIGREMGMRSIDPYFTNPDSLPDEQLAKMSAPPPDVEGEKAKAKMESDAALAKYKADLDAKTAADKARLDHDYRMADLEAKAAQQERDHQLRIDQANAELQLKRDMFDAEMAMKERLAMSGVTPNGAITTEVNLGGDPG